MRTRTAAWMLVTALLATAVGCGDDETDPDAASDPSSPPASSSPTTTPSPEATGSSAEAEPDVMAEPTVDGLFKAGPNGERLAVRCYGEGAPFVVYDAGSDDSGITDMEGSLALRELANSTTVCSFDRLARGRSDDPPNERRTLNDLVADIHAGLNRAGLRQPFVMVGSSWGGFDIFEYAGVHQDEVAGLVMLDVPKGQVDIQGVPDWDDPENAEHVDIVAAERQMAVERKPIPAIPVTAVTANFGQSKDKLEQKVWLEGSSDPRQVMVDSGHDVIREAPDAVVDEVLRVLRLVGGG